jgi:hypothetical protein
VLPVAFFVDSAEMARRGRIGAFLVHSRYDVRQTTAKARNRFLARFEHDVDPHGELPAEERRRRAVAARSAYFARLALKSARSRSKKRMGRA